LFVLPHKQKSLKDKKRKNRALIFAHQKSRHQFHKRETYFCCLIYAAKREKDYLHSYINKKQKQNETFVSPSCRDRRAKRKKQTL